MVLIVFFGLLGPEPAPILLVITHRMETGHVPVAAKKHEGDTLQDTNANDGSRGESECGGWVFLRALEGSGRRNIAASSQHRQG